MKDNDYYGDRFKWYVGIVTEVDPDGIRARVRVFGIHNMEDNIAVSDGDLPWAIIQYPVDATSIHTLIAGTWVQGFFVDGDNCQQPIITGVYGRGFTGPQNGSDVFRRSNPQGGFTPSNGEPLPTTSSTIDIPGDSYTKKAYNYIYNKLVSENLSSNPKMHASALTGVLMTETYSRGDLRPQVTNSIGAYGISQWLGSRKATLFRRYGTNPDFGQQLDYMWWEMNHSENAAMQRWLSANNLEDATAGAATFERNEAMVRGHNYVNRRHPIFVRTYNYAQQVYNTMEPDAFTKSDTPSKPINHGAVH